MNDTTESGGPPSGRFVLRIEPEMHAVLRAEADELGLSLNELCRRRLAGPGAVEFDPALRAAVRARSMFRGSLLGVIGYGSWARDEMTTTSDLDLLLVLRSETPITRGLYSQWDLEPMDWEGIAVEPHFVHLPEAGDRVSGTWAEVALEGIVLCERDFVVSRRLLEIRRRITAGELRRETLHGQPYWVQEETHA